MTADEIRGVVFQNAAVGGYKKSDVDLFLEEVAVCVESMSAKIKALEKAKFEADKQSAVKTVNLNDEKTEPKKEEVIREEPKAEPIKETPTEDANGYGIESLLLRVHSLAVNIENDAKTSAQQLLEKAAEDASAIIARADSEAETTTQKAKALLAEAERKEASINAAARKEAENIINEAVARSGQMLTATREQLKTERELCDKLRTEFTQVKNVIVGFYEDQLSQLNEMSVDSVEKTDVAEHITATAEPEKAEETKDVSSKSDAETEE